MLDSLEVLDASGHLTLTWDPTDPEQVSKAREEVERLRAAGYSFFAVVGSQGKDEVDAGNGTLLVERVKDPVRAIPAAPAPEKPRRGRPRKNQALPPPAPPVPGQRNIAVRPMAGG